MLTLFIKINSLSGALRLSQHQNRRSFSIGETATYSKTFTAADIETFAALSGDRNPVHLDESYAARTRFGRCIAHGILTTSLISNVIGMQLPGPGAIYLKQEVKFFFKPSFMDRRDKPGGSLSWHVPRAFSC